MLNASDGCEDLRAALLRQVHEENLRLREASPVARRRRVRRPIRAFASARRASRLSLVLLTAGVLAVSPQAADHSGSTASAGMPALQTAALTSSASPPRPAVGAASSPSAASPPATAAPAAEVAGSLAPASLNVRVAADEFEAERPPLDMDEYVRFFLQPSRPLADIFGLNAQTIVIDPGHGGKDPGTTGLDGTQEKDLTLDIARRLRTRLLARGDFRVLMTRDEDQSLPLNARVELANSNSADLFVSIHINSLPNPAINAIETYYFGPHEDEHALQLAERENRDSHYTLSDFKDIVEKVGDTLKLQESRILAMAIQRSLFKNIKRQNTKVFDVGIKTAPFVVLLGVDAAGVLAEVSCISNPEEERKLNTKRYREEIASYLEEGIVNYLQRNTIRGTVAYETERITEN